MNIQRPGLSLLGTPVTVEPSALMSPLNLFGLAVWLAKKPWPQRLRVGLFAALNYVIADIFHFGGHILSSQYAGAPMDEVLIKAPMPQAVYHDHDVSPEAHQLRSVGGPLGSGVAFLLTMLVRPFTRPGSAARDFLNTSAFVHGFLAFGSMLPLPFIDGGTILKWSLIERGQSTVQAEAAVRQANLGAGVLFGVLGGILTIRKRTALGLGLLANAAALIAAGLGKLR